MARPFVNSHTHPTSSGVEAPEPPWVRVRPDFNAAFEAVRQVEKGLERFTGALNESGVPYAIIGGNAVSAWVSTIDQGATRATKDIDVLLRRDDLSLAGVAVDGIGMFLSEDFGKLMFLERKNPSSRHGVDVILASEPIPVNPSRIVPDLTSARRSSQGFQVIDLPELVRMKLEANRRHDQVHIEDMLRVGLIDAKLAASLPEELLDRLRYIRDTMEWFTEPLEF